MMVGGRVVPGAIFDFAMHLFHKCVPIPSC
jgi:hypothetical protein